MTTYNINQLTNKDLVESLYQQGGNYTLSYSCKYGKPRTLEFYVTRNDYGVNVVVFTGINYKYEMEYLTYNSFTSRFMNRKECTESFINRR